MDWQYFWCVSRFV